jgi:hypothetical protein
VAGSKKPRRTFGALTAQPSPSKVAAVAAPTRTFGELAPEARQVGHSVMHPDCYAKCKGEIVAGPMWIHSPGCPYTVVLWDAHGKTKEDWPCAYGCEPQRFGSGWIHAQACPFWNATGKTPIGLKRPSEEAEETVR